MTAVGPRVQVLYDDGEDEWLDLRAEAARVLPPAAVSAGLATGAGPLLHRFLLPGWDIQIGYHLQTGVNFQQ